MGKAAEAAGLDAAAAQQQGRNGPREGTGKEQRHSVGQADTAKQERAVRSGELGLSIQPTPEFSSLQGNIYYKPAVERGF